MKVIDLLNKVANGEEVPKKVKVLDIGLLPEYQTITWNEGLGLYEYSDSIEFIRVLDKYHLNIEIEIIEDTPKEDKKIEKLEKLHPVSNKKQQMNNYILRDKLNEIIDRLNGEE